MRILLVTANLHGGGAERVLTWLAGRLADRGHDVRLLTWMASDTDFYPVPLGVARESAQRHSREAHSTLRPDRVRFLRLVRRRAREADVVLSFLTSINVATLLATTGVRTPVVVSERNAVTTHHRRLRDQLLSRILVPRRARVLVVQSESIAEKFHEDWGMNRTQVIPNAYLPGVNASQSIVREHVVLTVGRLVHQKNHASVIQAWAHVTSRYPRWTLRIVGDGPLHGDLRRLVSRLGVADSVELAPAHRNIGKEYARASIFVLPSRHEGFPNALLEAAGSGLPCIATDCPGASAEILEHGRAGVIVPVDDEAALATALDRLMSDPAERDRLGQAARRTVNRFDEGAVFAAWETLLSNTALGPRATSRSGEGRDV